jgi:hypothetical protein
MRFRIPALLAVAVLVTACLDPLPTPNGRYGTVTVPTYDAGGGLYAMRPEAAFYDKTDASYEPFPSDTCIITNYSPNSGVSGNVLLLDAGPFIFSSIGGRIDTLAPLPGLAIRYYRGTLTNGVPFVPGDTMAVTIPGATPGFPAAAISVRTAEAFTHGTIGIPAADAVLDLTWTPAPETGSIMTFSLRYANAFSTTGENEQIFCSFVDDGAAVIPAGYLQGWRTALNDVRSTRVVRVRSRQIDIDARTRLAIISTFARPVNTLEL